MEPSLRDHSLSSITLEWADRLWSLAEHCPRLRVKIDRRIAKRELDTSQTLTDVLTLPDLLITERLPFAPQILLRTAPENC